MARRHEHASTILTSNKNFEEWSDVFGDDVMATALIDRLLHHCHIVNIRGNSYLMRSHSDIWQTLQRQGQEVCKSGQAAALPWAVRKGFPSLKM